jgi:hypothetical protein
MLRRLVTERKPPGRATIPAEDRLFVGRSEAAQMLSISCRALDYLIGKKQLNTRRIGSRVLIPMADLLQFCRSDHPARLVGYLPAPASASGSGKDGFGRFTVSAACCADLSWTDRGSLPLSTPWPSCRPAPVAATPIPPSPATRGRHA